MTFLKRTFSSVVLLTLFFCSVFLNERYGKMFFALLAIPAAYFTMLEMSIMLKAIGKDIFAKSGAFLLAFSVVLILLKRTEFVLAAAFLLVTALWSVFLFAKNKKETLDRIFNTSGIYFMLLLPLGLAVWIYDNNPNRYVFLYLVLGTKIGDIGAYLTGFLSSKIMKGGNHKAIPSISPGKSWEGYTGGLLISVLFTVLYVPKLINAAVPLWVNILLGALMFIGGASGDLAESALKRTCGVKDSGRTLPGIGGIMDLVDSLLINTPLFCVYYVYLLKSWEI